MIEFLVWSEGFNGKDNPFTVFSYDAERAAVEFVEGNHSRLDYCEEEEVHVLAPDGTKTAWVVTVEMVPVFRATQRKEDGKEHLERA